MYSPITAIYLKDFMAFKEVTIDLTDPTVGICSDRILNLKGFNDSGKSSVLVALSVLMFNAYANKQKNFIRDGQGYFSIQVGFSDGTVILREKYSNGNSLYEMYRDDSLVFTTKVGNSLTPLEGVPQVIQDYLGLFSEGNFLLNVRRRTDPLLLVNTSGSDNFQLLNSVLKTSELAEAASMASKEANQKSQEVYDLSYRKRSLSEQIEGIPFDESLLTSLESCEGSFLRTQGIHESLQGMVDLPPVLPDFPSPVFQLEHLPEDVPEVPVVTVPEVFDLIDLPLTCPEVPVLGIVSPFDLPLLSEDVPDLPLLEMAQPFDLPPIPPSCPEVPVLSLPTVFDLPDYEGISLRLSEVEALLPDLCPTCNQPIN